MGFILRIWLWKSRRGGTIWAVTGLSFMENGCIVKNLWDSLRVLAVWQQCGSKSNRVTCNTPVLFHVFPWGHLMYLSVPCSTCKLVVRHRQLVRSSFFFFSPLPSSHPPSFSHSPPSPSPPRPPPPGFWLRLQKWSCINCLAISPLGFEQSLISVVWIH